MTSFVSLRVLAVSPKWGVEPSGPSSTRTGAESTDRGSLALLVAAPRDPGFFFLFLKPPSAGRRRTWNIMEPEIIQKLAFFVYGEQSASLEVGGTKLVLVRSHTEDCFGMEDVDISERNGNLNCQGRKW